VRGVRVAIEQKLPYVCVTASGAHACRKGCFSLVQMAKTTAALTDLAERRLPFHIGADGSDDGRRLGELRDDRRRGDRRTQALIGLPSAGDRADRAAEACRRLPARRVPAGEGRST